MAETDERRSMWQGKGWTHGNTAGSGKCHRILFCSLYGVLIRSSVAEDLFI